MMILIRGPTDVGRVPDPYMQALLHERLAQLSDGEPNVPDVHGELFVVEPGDTSRDIEVSIQFPILTNAVDGSRHGELDFQPNCDVIEDHKSFYEMVFAVKETLIYRKCLMRGPSLNERDDEAADFDGL
jgi:hypothetical protein